MERVIDGRTMAVRWPSGVPVTDVSLVLGDTVPVRIRVDHALTDCTPALAVKQTIGSADLVMTVTAFTRQDDWQEASWVVNTVPLQEALDSADRVELVGEVVLVAPDGAQHTSRPIRVTVRRDILPADYAPPVEVLADWSDLVATALAAQLPAALKDAGVELEAATGQSTLSSGDAADTWTIVGGYAMTWGDEILAGHLPDSCRLTSISTVYLAADGRSLQPDWHLRLCVQPVQRPDGHVGIYAGRSLDARGCHYYPGVRGDGDDALRAGHARRTYSVRPWAWPGGGGGQPARRERHDGPADDRGSGL